MKKFRQNVALALAYIAAAPFLLVGFIIWLFSSGEDECARCPHQTPENCETCKLNPENRKKKKKNRKCP